ncbi:hypothetical protein [uncultured Clostridium sp.]|uniref:hypothetical protein n=1 Tax=uncultured Clostridium sp. TaxID=59620 RepID=UPI0026F3966E|nr:hypothetical protein [uncultured Clostridium sp.]
MDYKEIKAKVESKKVEYKDCELALARDRTALKNIENDIAKLDNDRDREIEQDKALKLKILQDNATGELKKEIASLEQKRIDVQDEKVKTINSMDIEDYKRAYQYKLSGLDDVLQSIEKVPDLSKKYLGERLYNELEKNINQKNTKLVTDNLNEITDRMNSLQSKLGGIDYSRYLDWGGCIDKVFSNINPEKYENPTNIVAYIIVWVVIMFFTSKFLFPILLVVFAGLSCYNVFKSKDILKAMKIAKVVNENKQEILDSVNKSIDDHMKDDVAEYEKEFKKVDDDLVAIINKKQGEINAICRKVSDDFTYDTAEVMQRFTNRKIDMEKQCDGLQEEISKNEIKLGNIREELVKLNIELKESIDTIVDCYTSFDYKKDEKTQDCEFLVDMVNDTPIMYKHPLTSMFYLYKDLEESTEFIKLLMIQSMIRMNLRCYKPYIIDKSYMCSSFGMFIQEKWNNYVSMSVNTKEESSTLTELIERLQKRLRLFGGSSIEKYNDEKIKTESVPENYIWVFVIEPDIGLLNNPEFNQLLVNGSKHGIYVNIFISYEKFNQDRKSYLKTVSTVGNTAKITEGEIKVISRENMKNLCNK